MNLTVTEQDLMSARDANTGSHITGTAGNGDRVTFWASNAKAAQLWSRISDGKVSYLVPDAVIKQTVKARNARIRKGLTVTAGIAGNYLPGNYSVIGEDEQYVYIRGADNAGWSLDDYVIPRLASGLIFCEEIHDGGS